MAGDATSTTDDDNPIIGDTILMTSIRGSIIEVVVLMAGDTVPTTNAGGTTIRDTTSAMVASNLVIGSLALVTLVVEPPILVVCLKKFICHTKHLKKFYM